MVACPCRAPYIEHRKPRRSAPLSINSEDINRAPWPHLAAEEGHAAAVDPSEVCGSRHWLEVVLPLWRPDHGAGQLAVVHLNLVTLHRLLHCHQGVCNGARQCIKPDTCRYCKQLYRRIAPSWWVQNCTIWSDLLCFCYELAYCKRPYLRLYGYRISQSVSFFKYFTSTKFHDMKWTGFSLFTHALGCQLLLDWSPKNNFYNQTTFAGMHVKIFCLLTHFNIGWSDVPSWPGESHFRGSFLILPFCLNLAKCPIFVGTCFRNQYQASGRKRKNITPNGVLVKTLKHCDLQNNMVFRFFCDSTCQQVLFAQTPAQGPFLRSKSR